MRKTIITSNRSTTFTQSWLAKTSLLFFALAFVVFACKEDPNTIGFKPDRNKFQVAYKEIELPSSVLMAGPTITSNKGTDAVQRLLMGTYSDPTFGKIGAQSYLQFTPTYASDSLPPNAVFESLVLNLSLDYYSYGLTNVSAINFSVHELTDSLISEGTYFNTSSADYKSAPLGSASMVIDPSNFADHYARNTDTDTTNNALDILTVTLNPSYGESLLALAKERVASSTSPAKTTNSPTYSSFRKFRRAFKGFALRSDGTDKILGFNPTYSASGFSRSRLLLYYTYVDKSGAAQRSKIEFIFSSGPVSFSRITADRAGTPLQNFDQLYKEFYPDGDQRFIQSGNLVVTKFDIGKFFDFSDTISNMLINAAEIVIDPVELPSLNPPVRLGFKLLNSKNRYMAKGTDTLAYQYSAFVGVDGENNFILADAGSSSSVARNLVLIKEDNVSPKYTEALTRYFQMLYSLKDKKQRVTRYALFPSDPNWNKSLERLVFNKNNLKLRIYYTSPTTKKQE